jgi:hypothetical protein
VDYFHPVVFEQRRGGESFVWVRSAEEPTGAWESQEAQDAWREMPRMRELLGQCRESITFRTVIREAECVELDVAL